MLPLHPTFSFAGVASRAMLIEFEVPTLTPSTKKVKVVDAGAYVTMRERHAPVHREEPEKLGVAKSLKFP